MVCQNCGAVYDDTSLVTGYHFSSATYPKGSYTSPLAIATLDEEILTCGKCPFPALDKAMQRGSDRNTAGDERSTS